MNQTVELMEALRIIKKYCEDQADCDDCIMIGDCERLKITTIIKHPDL